MREPEGGRVPSIAPVAGHRGEIVDPAYAPIEAGTLWEILSVSCFAGSLVARFLVRWLLPPPQPFFTRVFVPALASLGLAAIGLLLGMAGMRWGRWPGLAKAGVFLNAVVLVLGGLLTWAFFRILPG